MYIPSDPTFASGFIALSGIAFIWTFIYLFKCPKATLSFMFCPFDKGIESLFVTPSLWLFFLATVNMFIGLVTGDLLMFFKQ